MRNERKRKSNEITEEKSKKKKKNSGRLLPNPYATISKAAPQPEIIVEVPVSTELPAKVSFHLLLFIFLLS